MRVLDLTTFLSGPLATHVLADLGAEIIKIEPPTGDPTRRGGAMRPGDPPSPFWVALHRDRKSVVLDLKSAAGREVFLGLAAKADVLVENFSPGVTTRLGVDFAIVNTINPALVYCSISGFGSSGPFSQMVAIDGPVQAFAGSVELSSLQTGRADIVPLQIADIAGAMTAAQAVLAALYSREHTGKGCYIDLSLLESVLQWLTVSDRRGSLAPPVTMILEGSDGKGVIVQTPLHFEERFGALLGEVPGFAEFVTDERFATLEARRAHLEEYLDGVRRAFRTRSSAEWLARLQEAGVPAGPVHTNAEALAHPQLASRQAATTVDVEGSGPTAVLASPFRFDGERRRTTSPPPVLGEHTKSCLGDLLGYDAETIAALAARGAFGADGGDGMVG